MSEPTNAPESTPRKGYVWIAWLVIVLAVGTVIGARMGLKQGNSDAPDSADSRSRYIVLELQGRYLVGVHHFVGPLLQELPAEVDKLNRGNVDERMRVIILIGEITSAREASNRLEEMAKICQKHNVALTNTQAHTLASLQSAYADFAAGNLNPVSVNEADRAFLLDNLGWFGELALNPKSRELVDEGRAEAIRPAVVTAIAVLSGALLAGLAICVGLVGMVIFAVMAWNGSLHWRFQVGSVHGGIYAETFALWLIFFFSASLSSQWIDIDAPRITQMIVVFFASLAVLAWPIARGVPFRDMKTDLGFVMVRHPLIEIAAGVWCYIVNLPLVLLGVAATFGMMRLQALLQTPLEGGIESFASEPLPSHPIVPMLLDGDWTTRAQIYVLASVCAPLVEETMFRGVLHRHCRELTGHWRPLASAFLSTAVVSFIFAAVHPQGLIAIPPLMFMAYGFSLAREWRASLLPSMFAHGMSNGIVLTLASIALSK